MRCYLVFVRLLGLDISIRRAAQQMSTDIAQQGDRSPRILDASTVPDWFGPNNGLESIAPWQAVKGRAYDFGVGYNMQTIPRSEDVWDAVRPTMSQLRFLADSCEIIRILIETRKDQLSGLNWQFRRIGSRSNDDSDPGVQWLRKFWAFPDREHDFGTWLRMWVEDLCTLDAQAIHVARFTDSVNYGKVAALELIDGANVKCLIDERGRRPQAPFAAYAHILKGLQAIHYSTWDLIYTPRNQRTNTLYGFGPVEQIKTIANMAIRRAALQLGYFTEGNAPDCIVPMKGTADQVTKFQATFDAATMGGQRTGKMVFIPADNVDKILFTKDQLLVDKFDEYLTRVACACFSESPTPYVSQVNRATAETAQDTATREGLHVQIKHLTTVINSYIIQSPMMLNMPDYEIYVAPEPLTDLEQVAAIVVPAVAGGIMRVDEARDMMGLVGDAPQPAQPTQPAPSPQPTQADEKMLQAEEAQQARQSVGRMARAARDAEVSRANAMRHETAIADKVGGWLQRMAEKCAKRVGSVQRAAGGDPLDAITDSDLDDFRSILSGPITDIYGASAADSAAEFLASKDLAALVSPIRDDAAQAARERGAWLVGRRYNADGKLVESPGYSITDEMRDSIKSVAAEAADQGWATERITQALQESAGFSRSRAATIARTEIVNAHEQGKLNGWKAVEKSSGETLLKRSILASNDNHAEMCVRNAAQGYIPVADEFQSGDENAPYHPNCMCTTVARRKGQQ